MAHQVENRLNSMLATEIRLPNTDTVADPDSLKNEAGMGHQSVNPEDRHCNSASAKGMTAHEVRPKTSQNASCWQGRERWLGQVGLSHNTFWPCPPAHHTVCNDFHFGLSPKELVRQTCSLEGYVYIMPKTCDNLTDEMIVVTKCPSKTTMFFGSWVCFNKGLVATVVTFAW